MQEEKYVFNSETADKLTSLLKELTSVGGISSNEEEAADFVIKKLQEVCDRVDIDKYGNVVGFLDSTNTEAKTLMLEAHMDRIGLMVSKICEDGSIKFASIGGFDERVLPSAEVCIYGTEKIYGIIYSAEKNNDKNPKIEQLRIDTGLSADEVKEKINIGDMILVESVFSELCYTQASCAAMDNRSGIAAILNALSSIDRGKLKYNLVILFSVQEELGLHGAYTAAENLSCEAAIVVDVTHGTTPDTKQETGVFPLGCGAVICRGPNFDYKYSKQLINTANHLCIPYAIEVASGPSGTSAWALQISGGGIPSMLVSIPLKYMHTNVEVLDIRDVDAVAALLVAAAEGGVCID